ncbi:hypothetical protein L3067_13150 [Xanthomonas sp. PPL568]|uniref:hypothetical protein n=1 Tax=Xanthomonas indica TaxID=2912242 RepID=UPI001F5A8181|nr:hypothetical protein [Xanthomonas indica]MCI2245554.1 hypothetical protein [Xanthomonas indica]
MHPHRVLAPARVALRPRSALAAAAGALLDRLQAGGLAAVEADKHCDPALNHLRIARRDAPGPAAYAMPDRVVPALIADVVACVRALPATHGATP